MEYSYYEEEIARPMSSETIFVETAQSCFNEFLDNTFIEKVNKNLVEIKDFHDLLCNLFYQVYYSSSSFALAAGRCSWDQKIIRDYLIMHAEEEKTHWCWILDDLKSTGYTLDPRSNFPGPQTTAYFSYAHFLANKNPLLRLAMAYFLEGLSAKFGQKIGSDVCKKLSLSPKQVSFFMKHGGLDQGHSEDVFKIMRTQPIDGALWAEMVNVIKCTAQLYKNLYNV